MTKTTYKKALFRAYNSRGLRAHYHHKREVRQQAPGMAAEHLRAHIPNREKETEHSQEKVQNCHVW